MSKAFIITNPMIAANKSAEVTLSKFLRVIKPCYEKIIVIGGNLTIEEDLQDVELRSFDIARSNKKIKRIVDILRIQIRMCFAINKAIGKNDQVFFWIADKMILPFELVKRKGAEINYFIYGNMTKEGNSSMFSKISSKLVRYMAEHADYICMESKSVITEWMDLKVKQMRIIHLYADSFELNPINERKKIFGMVCRLSASKHVLECIEAMAKIHEIYPEWKLEIIGSGKLQRECETLINRLDSAEYIELFGWIAHDKIINISKSWKYLLFPTDTEGMPNGLIEMMACGIPALASPVGGIKDILLDKVNGIYLKECSAETIADGMISAIEMEKNNDRYSNMVEQAYAAVKNEFTLQMAQECTLKELCNGENA